MLDVPGFKIKWGDYTDLSVDLDTIYLHELLQSDTLLSFLRNTYSDETIEDVIDDEIRKYFKDVLKQFKNGYFSHVNDLFQRLKNQDLLKKLDSFCIKTQIVSCDLGARVDVSGVRGEFSVFLWGSKEMRYATKDEKVLLKSKLEKIRREVFKSYPTTVNANVFYGKNFGTSVTFIEKTQSLEVDFCPVCVKLNISGNIFSACLQLPEINQSAKVIQVGTHVIGVVNNGDGYAKNVNRGLLHNNGVWKSSKAQTVLLDTYGDQSKQLFTSVLQKTGVYPEYEDIFGTYQISSDLQLVVDLNILKGTHAQRNTRDTYGIFLNSNYQVLGIINAGDLNNVRVIWAKSIDMPRDMIKDVERYVLACRINGELLLD